MLVLLAVVAIAAILRLVLLGDSREQWGQVCVLRRLCVWCHIFIRPQIVAVPVATLVLCFYPLSLPVGLIAAEILTTASCK
jgi:hypothetical protein